MKNRKNRRLSKCSTAIAVSVLLLSQSLPVFALGENSGTSSTASTSSSNIVAPSSTVSSSTATIASTSSSSEEIPSNSSVTLPTSQEPSSSVVTPTEPALSTSSSEIPQDAPTQPATSVVDITFTKAQLSIEDYKVDSPFFTVRLKSDATTTPVKSARIAIWSEENGQDDLSWIAIPIQSNQGSLSVDLTSLPKYTGKGPYIVHAYTVYQNGQEVGVNLGKLEFSIPAPSIQVEAISSKQYKVTIQHVPTTLANILVPIWSDKDGQDDLKWYRANHKGNGQWEVVLNVADHKHTLGHYQVHVYGTHKKTGKQNLLVAGSGFAHSKGKANASIALHANPNPTHQFDVSIASVKDTAPIEMVEVAVWSEKNGQDDLKWYRIPVADGKGRVTVDVRHHGNESGNYIVHVYTTYQGLGKQGTNLGLIAIQAPVSKHDLQAKMTEKGLQAQLVSTDVSDYSKVRLAVWSEANGQDDLKWYTPSKTGELLIPYTALSEFGKYQVHAYLSNNGRMRGLTTTTTNLDKPTFTSLIKKTSDTSYTIDVTNVPNYVSELTIPVWSEKGGQDDLKWYPAKKVASGHYQVRVFLSEHQFTTGKYQAHIYFKAPFLKNQYGGGVTPGFMVGDLGNARASMNITNVNHQAGRFDVVISNVVAPGGLQSVQVPVWSEINGQDDIRWYTAKKQGDGTYKVTVSAADHKYSFGKYHVHAYLVDSLSKRTGIAVATTHLDTPKMVTKIQLAYQGMGNYTVRFEPVFGAGRVKYAVWSEVGGQDDLKWYEANRHGDVVFASHFNVQAHSGTGRYQIHAYAESNGQMIGLGVSSFHVAKSHYQAPYFSQLDARWSGLLYGRWYFGPTGCVPATMAMIISGIKGNIVTPAQVGHYLHYNTLEFNRNFMGTSSRGIVLAAKHWGLKASALNSYAAFETALKEGYYIAAGVGNSKYVRGGGHQILLKGYQNGQTYVLDPYNPSNNGWTSLAYIWSVPSTDPIDRTEGMPFIRISD
ncbi:GBS Bsp-like repeat-containing protein [Streptococcus cameli]